MATTAIIATADVVAMAAAGATTAPVATTAVWTLRNPDPERHLVFSSQMHRGYAKTDDDYAILKKKQTSKTNTFLARDSGFE